MRAAPPTELNVQTSKKGVRPRPSDNSRAISPSFILKMAQNNIQYTHGSEVGHQRVGLHNLPADILLEIGRHLNRWDLISFSEVSHLSYRISTIL